MNRNLSIIILIIALGLGALALVLFGSCKSDIPTPGDTKFLGEFHLVNFDHREKPLKEGELNLYVDYSTCNALGQNSRFFQEVAASLVDRTTSYYAIKGNDIEKEEGDVYTLLRNIEEVNYAELKRAALKMAQGEGESVLITDGEYYTPSIARGHDNDPYLAEAFKTWILKGHDVHVISEPYVEPYNGANYNKKRFYILFTDDRMPNNIFDRITRTVDFKQFPSVDEFHIAASHPRLKGEGNNGSVQNELLNSKSQGYGTFEIEDWDGCDWKTIEDNIVCAVNVNTGNPLPNGEPIIKMAMDKNSFGCYRIRSLGLKVYDINESYNNFYELRANGQKVGPGLVESPLPEIQNFMLIDAKEFDRHSNINIHFNTSFFDPSVLTGKPFNYLKVDITVGEVEPIFSQHEDKFEFESITRPGEKNVSVASSIKQCLANADVIAKMQGQVIYSIYIKSEGR